MTEKFKEEMLENITTMFTVGNLDSVVEKIEIHYKTNILKFAYTTRGKPIQVNGTEKNVALFEEAAPYIEKEIRGILEKYFEKNFDKAYKLKLDNNTKKVGLL